MHLKVWWDELVEAKIFKKDTIEEKNGIVVGTFGLSSCNFSVVDDTGKFYNVLVDHVKKIQWVANPNDGE